MHFCHSQQICVTHNLWFTKKKTLRRGSTKATLRGYEQLRMRQRQLKFFLVFIWNVMNIIMFYLLRTHTYICTCEWQSKLQIAAILKQVAGLNCSSLLQPHFYFSCIFFRFFFFIIIKSLFAAILNYFELRFHLFAIHWSV